MNITVIGAGYVGLVTAACFAELGNHVTCMDVNQHKIALLREGSLPIYEPGLDVMVAANLQANRLQFVDDMQSIPFNTNLIFIAVGTPGNEEGHADIQHVLEAARSIGAHISHDCVIVDKSTVPVGMALQVKQIIQAQLKQRNLAISFEVVSNPEFLREGAAIDDFMRPDRIIIGLDSPNAKQIMLDLYLPIMRHSERIYFMRVKDAEMTKYAANAMLATRISFMNELALLCERMDVDIENVRTGIGSDSRIGNAFLDAGCGYGGSCFPKDVRALIKMAEQYNINPLILHAVETRNNLQKNILAEKIVEIFGEDLHQFTFAVWGLSFKPGTDDLREASAIVFIEEMLKKGASIQAYDPVAIPAARSLFPEQWMIDKKLLFAEDQYDALKNVDALVLATEWQSFCFPDLGLMKKIMRKPFIFDGRNQYDPMQVRAAGFDYIGIGRKARLQKADSDSR